MSKAKHRARTPRWPKLTAGAVLAVGFVALLPMSAQARTQQSESHTSAPAVATATGTFGSAPTALGRKATLSPAWVHPLPGAPCRSGWGAPRDGGARQHKGVDLYKPLGTPVRAVHAGTVVVVRYSVDWDGFGAGWYVVVDHGDGTRSVYMHLRARTWLPVGAKVAAAQTIAHVGRSGTRSAHLHFETHHGAGNRVNPTVFMAARGVRVGC